MTRGRAVRAVIVVAALLAIAVAAAFAVPLIQLTVQQLGAGSAVIIAPVGKAWVNHVIVLDEHGVRITAVKVKFDKDLPAGSQIIVELRDADGNVLAKGYLQLQNDLEAGEWATVWLDQPLGLPGILAYHEIAIVVAGPEVTA